jgi:hypothetical protein
MAGNIVQSHTGLKVKEVKRADDCIEVHAYSKKANLGYFTVSRTVKGTFLVAGSTNGSFMENGQSDSLFAILNPEFKKLEAEVNEKSEQTD